MDQQVRVYAFLRRTGKIHSTQEIADAVGLEVKHAYPALEALNNHRHAVIRVGRGSKAKQAWKATPNRVKSPEETDRRKYRKGVPA